MKHSIRKEINKSYLNIYLLIAFLVILSALLSCYVFIHFYYFSITKDDFKDIRTKLVQSPSGNIQMVYEIDPFQGREMIIIDHATGKPLNQVSFRFKEPNNLFDQVQMEIQNNRIMISTYFATGTHSFNAYVFYHLDQLMQQFLFVTMIPLFIILSVGFIILWLAGTNRTGKLLHPIREINQIAKQITSVNLDYHIDVDDIQYELKDLAMTLNNMLERIHNDYNRQKEFVSDVSHEMRTPIAVISGYISMLDRWGKEEPEILKESIEAIKQETQNMKQLIENLLFLARSDNNSMIYHNEIIDLGELIQIMLRETTLIDNLHHFQVTIKEKVLIKGDTHTIKQAFRILIDNAIKYTPENGNIHLSVGSEEAWSYFTIVDTGIGIDAKELPYIFQRFYRSDKSRNKKTGGNGLGLAICRTIIHDHQGKIIVKSKVGQGTEIKLLLPLIQPND